LLVRWLKVKAVPRTREGFPRRMEGGAPPPDDHVPQDRMVQPSNHSDPAVHYT